MTITPGTPDDWTDTVEPERAEAFTERLPDGVGYNLRHYGNVAHRIGEECYCRPSRIPHTAPESARAATLTPEQPVKAPGQDGDLLLTRGTPVEAKWASGDRLLYYVDEGGYQIAAGKVGNGKPLRWDVRRIVRVLTEDKPTQEPVLPRPIEPEDVRVGMVVERRKGESYVGGRVKSIDRSCIGLGASVVAWTFGGIFGHYGWSLWLIEDAPAPVDPDAAAIEVMARAAHELNCAQGWYDWDEHGESAREMWRKDARAVLAALRETHDVTARAEQ